MIYINAFKLLFFQKMMDAPEEEMTNKDGERISNPYDEEKVIPESMVSELIKYLDIQGEKQKDFRNRILDWHKRNKFLIKGKVLRDWAHVVQDFNKIHIYSHYAEKEGFKTNIVHGTLISAHYENYVLDFLDIVNDFSGDERKLVYSSQRMKFGKPLYPHKWSKRKNEFILEKLVCEADADKKEGIELTISVIDPRRNPEEQIIVPSAKASFRYAKNEIPQEYISSFLSESDIVERSNMELSEDELEDFYRCLGMKPKGNFPMMYGAALCISTILKFASKETGKPKGTYRQMKLEFYNTPEILKGSESIFKTILRMPLTPRHVKDEITQEEGYAYMFKALTLQDGKIPILEGTFSCFSKDKLFVS